MNIQWERSIQTGAPRDQVYSYLSDFSRHREWSRTLERMERIADGDALGRGARYMTHERLEFASESAWKRRMAEVVPTRTLCEVTELAPNRRIVWRAQPVPSFGGTAELSFDLLDGVDGGTIVVQRVVESYPRPVAFMLRVLFNVTADGICEQLKRTLDVLKSVLDDLPAEPDTMPQAAGG